MRIKSIRSLGKEQVVSDQGLTVYESPEWRNGLLADDLLLALCGHADNTKFYTYHEGDMQWMQHALRIAGELSRHQVGALAISDPAKLRAVPSALMLLAFNLVEPSISLQAACALAIHLYQNVWNAAKEDAVDLVRMNVFTERRVAV